MSSRGRGYGRGYGGNPRGGGGYRGGYRGGGSSRGSYENRGGGGRGYSSNFDKYSGGNSDRYRFKEEPFKKPYRSESSHYGSTSRDYSSRGMSPDRKKMRIEGSSDRRSHEYGGGSSYSRQETYPSNERRSYNDERRRSPPRESYRKPARSPVPFRGRGSTSRRISRGRPLRSRGSYRTSTIRSRGTFISSGVRRIRSRPYAYKAFTRPRVTKIRSSIKAKGATDSSTDAEEEWDGDDVKMETNEDEEVKPNDKADTPKKPEGEEDETKASEGSVTDKEGVAGSGDEGDADALPVKPSTPFYCPHCKEGHKTVANYARHIKSAQHRTAMAEVGLRYRRRLLRMRAMQRDAQRELESAADVELLNRAAYCPICRLNYRTSKMDHTKSGPHKQMKRMFAMKCTTCSLAFRSPIIYEHHICSIDHLKKKARAAAVTLAPSEAGSDPGADVDLHNFMTLDSVGDVDVDDDDEESGAEEKKDDESKPKKVKAEINYGSEHIKKVEVHYCDICRVYLERGGLAQSAAATAELIRRHCRLRIHLNRYIHHRDTRTLRRQAEKIHKQMHKEKEEEKPAEEPTEKETLKPAPNENGSASAVEGDEKLWADVDELLADVDAGNKSSDDDDELNRYDKFRKSSVSDKETENVEVAPAPAPEATA